jgi:DNA-binding LacI/PurR family transcriptional regulator
VNKKDMKSSAAQPEKRVSLWRTVYTDLLARAKAMEHGQHLTVLEEICRDYRVSLITARRAANELAREGYAENRRRVGIIVRKRPEKMLIKLVLPKNYRQEELLSGRAAVMRLYEGMTKRALELNTSVALMSECGVESLLHENAGRLGFVIHQEVDPDVFDILKGKSVPFVSFPYSDGSEPCVTHDLKQGMYLAARHLLVLGHRRIALLGGAITSVWVFPRYKGYLRALHSAGVPFDWALVKETNGFDAVEDERALRAWLRLPHPPTAILAGNDERAIHLLEYCARQGIRVPEELSIVGFDNIAESSLTRPALTTVDTHLDRIGAEAVNILVALISGNRARSIVVKPDLVVRESTEKSMGNNKRA